MRIVVASIVALLGIAATAHAQAPGEYVAAVGPGHHDVMADRWSVGFGVGSVGLAAPGATSATSYGIGELALRFRLAPHFELEGTLGGGSSSDGGTSSVGMSTLGARYIFQPHADWNVWVVGAVGVLAIDADAQDSSTQVNRAMAELGMGIERRWSHFALQAELRAIGASAPKQSNGVATMDLATTTPEPAASDDTLSGAELTFGASWYF